MIQHHVLCTLKYYHVYGKCFYVYKTIKNKNDTLKIKKVSCPSMSRITTHHMSDYCHNTRVYGYPSSRARWNSCPEQKSASGGFDQACQNATRMHRRRCECTRAARIAMNLYGYHP